jgi:hypothetical protein
MERSFDGSIKLDSRLWDDMNDLSSWSFAGQGEVNERAEVTDAEMPHK